MSNKATIITVVIAVLLGVVLGLTRAEDKRYSYKV